MTGWYDRNRHRYPDGWPEASRRTKIISRHHLDHDPSNLDDANLLAACQSCHLKISSLKPRPGTKAEAIERMQGWISTRGAQRTMDLEGVGP